MFSQKPRKFVLKRIEGSRIYEMWRNDKFCAALVKTEEGWTAHLDTDHSTQPFPTALRAADEVEVVEQMFDHVPAEQEQ